MFDSKSWYYFDASLVVPSRTSSTGIVYKRYYQRGPMKMTADEARNELVATPQRARVWRYGPYGWEEKNYSTV